MFRWLFVPLFIPDHFRLLDVGIGNRIGDARPSGFIRIPLDAGGNLQGEFPDLIGDPPTSRLE